MELLEQILDDKNLFKAYKQVYKNNAHMVANTRRGYYWVASTVVLHIAISNKRLKKKV